MIGFRVLQGAGAALLWPTMIGMACAAVGESNRGFALGSIFGTCSLGNSAGPVVGGALTEWLSWRWVLWINAPMALFSILMTARHGIVLAPDRRQAVQELIAGARNVHALPLRTAVEVDDLAGIVDRAYQSGLSAVHWLSAALVLISLFLVLRFVRPGEASPPPVAAHAAESPHR